MHKLKKRKNYVKYKFINRKWTHRIALSILSALLVTMAGCGSSEGITDTEAAEEDRDDPDENSVENEEDKMMQNYEIEIFVRRSILRKKLMSSIVM